MNWWTALRFWMHFVKSYCWVLIHVNLHINVLCLRKFINASASRALLLEPWGSCLPESLWNPVPHVVRISMNDVDCAWLQHYSHCMCTCVIAPTEVTPSPSSAAQRRAQRRVTRVDNRYHSGLSNTLCLTDITLVCQTLYACTLTVCLSIYFCLFLFMSFSLIRWFNYFDKIVKNIIHLIWLIVYH